LDRVRETDVAALTGLLPRELRRLLAGVPSTTGRGDEPWYRWRDIAPLLGRSEILSARRTSRDDRILLRLSKHWLAGYPQIVAR
jgi:hypothetical protein